MSDTNPFAKSLLVLTHASITVNVLAGLLTLYLFLFIVKPRRNLLMSLVLYLTIAQTCYDASLYFYFDLADTTSVASIVFSLMGINFFQFLAGGCTNSIVYPSLNSFISASLRLLLLRTTLA